MHIEIFTGPSCAYCAAAKRLLEERGRTYLERDVSDETCLTEFRERLPRHRSLPQIFVDGAHIGGYEDLRLRIDGLAGK